jgi:hypothetical protein
MKTKLTLTLLAASMLLFTGCQTTDYISGLLYDEKEVVVVDEAGKPVLTTDGHLQTEVELTPKPITRMVVGAAGAAPVPYLETGLTVLLAAFGSYAAKQRKKASVLEGLTASTIAGVEAFSKTDEGKEVAKALKGKINETATYLGYDKELHEKVQKIVSSGKNA